MLSRIAPIRPKPSLGKTFVRRIAGLGQDLSDADTAAAGLVAGDVATAAGGSFGGFLGGATSGAAGFTEGEIGEEAATGGFSSGIGTSIINALSNVGAAVLPGLLGRRTAPAPTTPKPGIAGFLTSTPVLIGGGVLVALLLLRKKSS